jgi:hypothetical protein
MISSTCSLEVWRGAMLERTTTVEPSDSAMVIIQKNRDSPNPWNMPPYGILSQRRIASRGIVHLRSHERTNTARRSPHPEPCSPGGHRQHREHEEHESEPLKRGGRKPDSEPTTDAQEQRRRHRNGQRRRKATRSIHPGRMRSQIHGTFRRLPSTAATTSLRTAS